MSAMCIRCGVNLEADDCHYCTRCSDMLAEHNMTSKPPDDVVSEAV